MSTNSKMVQDELLYLQWPTIGSRVWSVERRRFQLPWNGTRHRHS